MKFFFSKSDDSLSLSEKPNRKFGRNDALIARNYKKDVSKVCLLAGSCVARKSSAYLRVDS